MMRLHRAVSHRPHAGHLTRVETCERPPAEVIAARDAVAPPSTLIGAVAGDPPPGRSALDARVGKGAT
jgi:hypothetical protein